MVIKGHGGRSFSRRKMLQLGGALALTALSSPWLTACGHEAGRQEISPTASNAATPHTPRSSSNQLATTVRQGLKRHLVMWTYFSEVQLFARQFEQAHPGVRVDVKVFPGSDYETKMRLALQTGQNAPDIFDLERGYIGKYLDAPFVEDLTPMGAEELVRGYVPYAAALGRDQQGRVKAVTDNASPGGFWYRRDLAKEYLGTEDPQQVSEMVNDWQKIIALGKKVVAQSRGKVHLLASYADVIMVHQYWLQPWVSGNALRVDPGWTRVMDIARDIRLSGVDAKLDAFSPAWGAAWNNGSVIMFAWPSWAEFLIDKEKTSGKWGIAKAPKGYYAGGTYRAIYTGSHNKDLAFELIKFIAQPAWQTYNLQQTHNMPALQKVYERLADSYHPRLFAGQPVLKTYYPIAMEIPARSPDKYSEAIQSLFNTTVSDMIRKGQSNEEAMAAFKQQVRNAFPELQVD